MIAKGLDLPMVTLVGVVLADVGLFLPDFRASERVFGLIEQVAGRAGRGLLPGRVIVQSYNPEHPAIAFAAAHDVDGFTRYELAQNTDTVAATRSRIIVTTYDANRQVIGYRFLPLSETSIAPKATISFEMSLLSAAPTVADFSVSVEALRP